VHQLFLLLMVDESITCLPQRAGTGRSDAALMPKASLERLSPRFPLFEVALLA